MKDSRFIISRRMLGRDTAGVFVLLIALLTGVLQGCATAASGLHVDFPNSVEIPSDPMAGRPRLEFDVKPLTPELLESLALENAHKKKILVYPDLDDSVAEYRISPFDVLQITVWDHPELNVAVPVAGTSISGDPASSRVTGHLVDTMGNIFFPHVGELNVAGKTISQIRTELTVKLSMYIPDPQLDVRVSAYRSKRVFVLGQVENGGAVTINDTPMRILDAITMTEGVTEEADLENVKLVRNGKSINIDLAEIFFNGNLEQNYLLQDEDVIHVPDTENKKIYMIGEFREPGSHHLRNHRVTLADAIDSAKGLNPNTSNANYVLIFRMVNENDPVLFLFNANVPEHLLLSTQFIMEPYDIVYVPPTTLTVWNRIVQQVLPTINSLSRLMIAVRNWQIIVD